MSMQIKPHTFLHSGRLGSRDSRYLFVHSLIHPLIEELMFPEEGLLAGTLASTSS